MPLASAPEFGELGAEQLRAIRRMRIVSTCLLGFGLMTLAAVPALAAGAANPSSGDLVPGGWLQPPPPPQAAVAETPLPAAVPPAPGPVTPAPPVQARKPPRPRPHPTARQAQPAVTEPNPTGQVRF